MASIFQNKQYIKYVWSATTTRVSSSLTVNQLKEKDKEKGRNQHNIKYKEVREEVEEVKQE